VDTNPSKGQYELPSKQIFKGMLGKLENASNVGLSLGNRPFYKAAYDETLRQQMKLGNTKIPSQSMLDASKILPAKVDTLGRTAKQFIGNNNLYNVFSNPGYTTQYSPTAAEKLVTDVYNSTGDKGIFPRVSKDTITYKDGKENKTIQLTPEEKQALQAYIGKQTLDKFTMESNSYNTNSDNVKVSNIFSFDVKWKFSISTIRLNSAISHTTFINSAITSKILRSCIVNFLIS
jgi:hypothetical protein